MIYDKNELLIETANGIIQRTFDKKDGVRSPRRTNYFNKQIRQLINDDKIVSFEKKVPVVFGFKKSDILIVYHFHP